MLTNVAKRMARRDGSTKHYAVLRRLEARVTTVVMRRAARMLLRCLPLARALSDLPSRHLLVSVLSCEPAILASAGSLPSILCRHAAQVCLARPVRCIAVLHSSARARLASTTGHRNRFINARSLGDLGALRAFVRPCSLRVLVSARR